MVEYLLELNGGLLTPPPKCLFEFALHGMIEKLLNLTLNLFFKVCLSRTKKGTEFSGSTKSSVYSIFQFIKHVEVSNSSNFTQNYGC